MYKSLSGTKEVRTERGITFFYGKGNEKYHLGTGCLVHHRILSSVKRVEFVSDRISCIVLRGRWCNTIVSNVHTPRQAIRYDSKHNSYEELEQVFDHFPKYHLKMLLGEFNAKFGR